MIMTGKRAKLVQAQDMSHPDLWYYRYRHAGADAIAKLPDAVKGVPHDINFKSDHTCKGCAMGKATQAPFPASPERSNQPLEIIHSDLVEMPLPALQTQERYCVTFLDDYSSFGTMYFIKYKDETLKAFQAFQAWAKNQTGHKIKTFQSDGGGEFMSKEFQTYLEQKGIERQTSMPRTPQQNGRAER
jgi:hypothetical protein